MSVVIEAVREASDEVVAAFGRLLPQLSAGAAIDREAVERVVGSEGNTVLAARAGGVVVGLLTLVIYPLASGVRARIEDVVVDGAARGQGVGAALTGRALELARERGARTVDLTSRPEREAANRLYERAGFRRRDTASYRVVL
ncbi:GNAT family N-acetyltransferase [Nonomuraea harbinensis]|uniref:GNAT family N-acetyltransferase n=1 Tax=Nonomuraea harbinensis TaxID=1286938 RepID=A0ABW1C729_9ACTN|nr:GNAT family N-acetyltransferase [Nonomuraea harbinensis]